MTIARPVLRAVIDDATRASPRECCGLLLGTDDRIVEAVRARNLAESASRYLIDPEDHIRARRAARVRALEVVGFYHSHPASRAWPSPSDIAEASDEDAVWMIVGVSQGEPEIRLFAIANGQARELTYDVDG